MLEELYIWRKIFEQENNDLDLKNLIKLVVEEPDAREYIFKKVKEKSSPIIKRYNININLDKNIEKYDLEELSDMIINSLENALASENSLLIKNKRY